MGIVLADDVVDPRRTPEHLALMRQRAETSWRTARTKRERKAAAVGFTPDTDERRRDNARMVQKRRERFG